jgi:hypothetical protein
VHTFTNGVTLKTAGTQTITATGTAIPPGIVSWWPGNGNANDIIGSNNGTLVGGASFGPGVSGQAFRFNGNGQYVSVGGSYSIQGPRSLIAWVNFQANSLALGEPIVTAGSPGQGDFFAIAGTGGENSNVHQNALYIDHWGHAAYSSSRSVAPNQWTHVAMTYDGNNTVTFYINGQAAGSVSGSLYDYNINSFAIGGNVIGGTTTEPSFKGLIDEVAFFNRALSPAEIQSIYKAGSASLHKTITGSASVTVATATASATTFSLTPVGTAPSAGIPVNTVAAGEVTSGNVANADTHAGMVPFQTEDSAVVLRTTPRKSANPNITAVDELFAWNMSSDLFGAF